MQQVTINVYDFEELDEKIKERLIKEEIQAQNEIMCENCLYDDMNYKAYELLEEHFKNHEKYKLVKDSVTPWYNLGYSQGDGALIEFSLEDKKTGEVLEIRHNDNFYCHKRAFTIDNTYVDMSDEDYEQLKSEIIDINDKLTSYGYHLIEEDYIISKEDAIFYLTEYRYLKNGEQYHACNY